VTILEFPDREVDRPVPDLSGPPPPRRRVRGLSRDTLFDVGGAVLTGLSVSVLLFGRLAALSGPIGFCLVAYVVFLIVYAVLVSMREDGPAVRDAVMTALLTSAACIAFAALGLVIAFTLWRGRTALAHSNFFTHDMSKAGPLAPLTEGGVAHALVGTMWMIGIAIILSVPLGLVCAVYLDQTRSRPARFVRTIVEAMTALPTILAGLFIYASWILTLGFEESGLAAALALSIMMLPYMIRTSDLVLRLVPNSLREASSALGAPRWRTVWHVVLPTARSGLATAVILAIARAIGEASPVLLTAGFTTYLNADPMHGPMVSLPLEALKLVQSGVPSYVARGFATAAFLLLVILGLFILARIIGGWGPGNLSSRQRRRLARASARDTRRFGAGGWTTTEAGGIR
jgi:phosphate transport system permease protein